MSSSSLLSVQRFGRYALWPSSGISFWNREPSFWNREISCCNWEPSCRNREPAGNFEPNPLFIPQGYSVLIPLTIAGVGVVLIIRTGYPRGLNKGLGSKFRDGSRVRKEGSRVRKEGSRVRKESSQVRQEIPEEGRKAHRPKRCTDNNEDEDNSPNNTNNTNYQASS